MINFSLFVAITSGLIIIGLLGILFVFIRNNKNRETAARENQSQGYGVGTGVGMGVGFGVALGIAFDNLALGIGIGMAIGAALGSAWEQNSKDKLHQPAEHEKKLQRWGIIIGIVFLLISIGIYITLLLIKE